MSGSRTHARGRVCAAPGCATVLSVYNPDALCALHHSLEDHHRQAARARGPLTARSCETCGAPFQAASPARRFCSDACRMTAFYARRKAGQGWTRSRAVGPEAPGFRGSDARL